MSTAAELPKSTPERALAAVPVILTVLATILAGLSSSEMTQSMYFRSLASQNQAKAGSQWGFFQAKRIRGTTMESTGDVIRALTDPRTIDADELRRAGETMESSLRRVDDEFAGQEANLIKSRRTDLEALLKTDSVGRTLQVIAGGPLPAGPAFELHDEQLRAAVEAVRGRQTEVQTAALVAHIPSNRIEEAIEAAEAAAAAFDDACKPITKELSQIEQLFESMARIVYAIRKAPPQKGAVEAVDTAKHVRNALRAAREEYTARRYSEEAGFNQRSAELFEVLARRNGAESDRHRQRSKNFFYAMLCAQAGVTVASFALARSRKSWFWGVAGIAGVLAVIFGAYVYLAL